MTDDRRTPGIWRNLFLVRHGESTANEINRFAGDVDAPLTRLGLAQAKVAGKTWGDAQVDRIYVSPMLRARQTADILLNSASVGAIATPGVVFDERLIERRFGEFTLGNKTSLQRRCGLDGYEAALYHDQQHVNGAEPFADFRQRILDFIKNEIYPVLQRGSRVLIVAHKYVIELLSRLVLRLPESRGYDLRLPNARIIAGDQLAGYVRRESRLLNRLSDSVVVHHATWFTLAAVLGLLINAGDWLAAPPRSLLLVLLGLAAAISLARISLGPPTGATGDPLISPSRLFIRFMALPWIVTLGIVEFWGYETAVAQEWATAIGLLLAAPTAVTAVILARTSGGMILPTALVILASTVISLLNTVALVAYFDQTDLVLQASLFVVVSSISLLLPLLAAQVARRLFPVTVAKAAEDHGALAVILLALFIVLSFQQIPLESFYPWGVVALALGILLRAVALKLSRQDSLYGVDDYFSMAYPNVFLVIVLAVLMGNDTLLNLATWFLVPMFMMSPLDDFLVKPMVRSQAQFGLNAYLNIEGDRAQAAESDAVLVPEGPGQRSE